MRRRIIIAAVAALLLAPLVFLAVLAYSELGVRLVATQLWRLERFGVHVTGISGTLSGPLHVERFELEHPRVHVSARDITIEPQLRGLLLQTIQMGAVRVATTEVVLRRVNLPASNRPPRFLPRFMRIDARGVELAQVRYVHLNGTAVVAERLRGRVTIGSRELLVRDFAVQAPQFDAAGELRLLADRPTGLQGKASGHVRSSRGTQLAVSAQVDGTLDRLTMQAQMHAPYVATAEGVLTRPQERWQITGRLASPSFGLQPWLERPPFSLRNVLLDVEVNPDDVSIDGNVGIPELDGNDLTVQARGRLADRVLTLFAADVALNDTPAKLHASGTITLGGSTPALALAGRWNNLQWPLHGTPLVASTAGEATLEGSLPYAFAVTGQVGGPKIPPVQGRARGALSREEVDITEYQIDALGGSLAGAAKLAFAKPRAWRLSTRATDIDPAHLHREFPGRIAVVAEAHGVGTDSRASFTVALRDAHGTLRQESLRASGVVQRDGRYWRAQDVSLGLGGARLTLDGTLRNDIDARWSLHAPALDRLLPQAAGAVDFSGTARGSLKAAHVVADLQARKLRYQGWAADELTISADIDAATDQPSRLSIQARQLGRGAPLIDTLRLAGDGTASDHRIGVDVTGIAREPRQAAPQASLMIAGRYAQQTWNATITTARLSAGAAEQAVTIAEAAQVMASRNAASLSNLCLVIGAGRMCAQGEWQRGGAWQGTVSGYEIPLASVLPATGEEVGFAGRIEGRVHAFGAAGKPWQGNAGMRIIDAAIIYRPSGAEAQTLNLGTGGLGATATAERISLSFGIQAFTDTFVYANAQLERGGAAALMSLPLTGDVRARAADANILPLVFPEIDHAAGLLTANATVGGTLALPEVTGRVQLENGEFDSYRVNLALRELGVSADLARTGLTFRGQARAGDGQLAADGAFSWHGGQSQGTLSLRGENLLVADLPEYRVVASPDLRFRIAGEQIDVAGDVVIPSARIQPAQLTGAVRPSQDARYVGEHAAERAGRFKVRSEVRIAMGDDVRVDAFGLQGRVVGAVGTTVRTDEEPAGRGELSVADGRYEAYGQKLEISRGRLLFEASPLDDPGLDIEARRTVETVTVGLNVRGTLQEPRLTFFSDPSMPQTQIVSYLLTGKSIDDGQRSDTTTINSARDSLALQGGGFLASQLGRRIGIEEVGVESSVTSAGEANTSLVLGKFLSPRLFISYGISLTESINTLKLRYTISDRWILRTEAGENQSADLEYTIER